ncbi:hypothetical protein CGCSCA4_v004923 [Colletotrichum siamense]|uniref:Uncharacterized protein n=1 Tax=Colletotrichum siamense TaxID=690259 RepID=A0A9P5F517_COLSI|nr:uncharacterized protein CGCS363_v001866 [Colletotrichum siamense]XP_037185436.1 uncharacterized protein CGCA056_v001869 [Colletotrichum aenigma]KAF4808331.1 hypothetical protein CGCSCA5_v012464 [Colletotrichum siamense]KAF4848410.1 hypothetical protein CGCSCA4_v004923 [Colletotrichum siamense]KAF4866732.1 hypothetical protein CGCSCA2_v000150 [Colletotrichum siamense]KAF4876794.1 hypothetical protein CGCSCA1_v004140 [Colletotrichum siamense]KAF5516682.1 hypothetical protein CGCS363_v001866 
MTGLCGMSSHQKLSTCISVLISRSRQYRPTLANWQEFLMPSSGILVTAPRHHHCLFRSG